MPSVIHTAVILYDPSAELARVITGDPRPCFSVDLILQSRIIHAGMPGRQNGETDKPVGYIAERRRPLCVLLRQMHSVGLCSPRAKKANASIPVRQFGKLTYHLEILLLFEPICDHAVTLQKSIQQGNQDAVVTDGLEIRHSSGAVGCKEGQNTAQA